MDEANDKGESNAVEEEKETTTFPRFDTESVFYNEPSPSEPEKFFDSMSTLESPIGDWDGKEEEETLKVPNLTWKLLKDKLHAVAENKLSYDSKEEVLHITGKDVVIKKNIISSLLQRVNKVTLQLSPEQEKILKNKAVQMLLDAFCGTGIENTVCDVTQPTLNLYGLENVEEKLEKMKSTFLKTCSVIVPACVPKSKVRDCEDHYNSSDGVSLTFNEVDSELTVTGLSSDVSNALGDMTKMFEEYEWEEGTFAFDGRYALFVNTYSKDQLIKTLRNADIVEESNRDGQILISYKCQKLHKKKLEEDLTIFQRNIVTTKVNLNAFDEEELELIKLYWKEDAGLLKDFETSNTCCIFVENNGDNVETVLQSKDVDTTKVVEQLDDQTMKENSHDLYSSGAKKVLTLGSSCAVQILPDGDIIKESSDLLVCGLHDSLNMMKTRVSAAFKRMDSSLQDEIKTSQFSGNGVYVLKRGLLGTSCRSIAFIILKTWYQGMSDQRLIAAVIEVLNTANKRGFQSVSIPPLSNKYPTIMVARAISCAVDTFVKTNPGSLNKVKTINLLLPDRLLFTDMVNAMDTPTHDLVGDNPDGLKKEVVPESTFQTFAKGFSKLARITGMILKPLTLIANNLLAKPRKKPDIVITIVHGQQEDLASKLTSEIRKHWLVENFFKPGNKFDWPPRFMDFMSTTANLLNVKAEKVEDPRTKRFVCKIKGKVADVQKMKDALLLKMFEVNQQKKLLFSSDTPSRGTVKFIEHAVQCDNQFPSYWESKWEDFEESNGKLHQCSLHTVNRTVFKAVERLVLNTWDRNRVGAGYDAANIPSKSQVKVISVQRVENPSLFSNYFWKRQAILRDMKRRDRLCQDIGHLPASKGPVQTTRNLDEDMKHQLLHEVNEQYFFHGTKERTANQICHQGIDCRLSDPDAMFGQGVYTTESSTKADQYADNRHSHRPNGSTLTMILTRVVLGEVFSCDDKHKSVQNRNSTKLKRPPCLSCREDVCKDTCRGNGQFYHSVMGDGKWIFREFVVYSNDQCYPEYLIKYKRV